MDMVKQLSEQARDGTLSEVTQLRIYYWRVRNEPTDYARNRREIAGSGDKPGIDDDEDDYPDENEEDDEYDDDYDTEASTKPTPVDEHPHRHHHGEENIGGIGAGGDANIFDVSSLDSSRILSMFELFFVSCRTRTTSGPTGRE